MPETIIADVAGENTAYSFDREFRYLVPQPLAGEGRVPGDGAVRARKPNQTGNDSFRMQTRGNRTAEIDCGGA